MRSPLATPAGCTVAGVISLQCRRVRTAAFGRPAGFLSVATDPFDPQDQLPLSDPPADKAGGSFSMTGAPLGERGRENRAPATRKGSAGFEKVRRGQNRRRVFAESVEGAWVRTWRRWTRTWRWRILGRRRARNAKRVAAAHGESCAVRHLRRGAARLSRNRTFSCRFRLTAGTGQPISGALSRQARRPPMLRQRPLRGTFVRRDGGTGRRDAAGTRPGKAEES